jgi:hypothetical protein
MRNTLSTFLPMKICYVNTPELELMGKDFMGNAHQMLTGVHKSIASWDKEIPRRPRIFDIHPDIAPRKTNDIELAQRAAKAGMGGLLLKAHHGSTVERAYLG